MENLKDRVRNYDTEFIEFKEKVRTVKQAQELLDIPSNEIIKSLVMIGDEPILCIVPGNKSIDFKKLRKFCENIRLASEEEVLNITGYKVGGVPPILNIKVSIDKRVMNKEYVYGGGGSDHALLKIKPQDIANINRNIEIVNIAK